MKSLFGVWALGKCFKNFCCPTRLVAVERPVAYASLVALLVNCEEILTYDFCTLRKGPESEIL